MGAVDGTMDLVMRAIDCAREAQAGESKSAAHDAQSGAAAETESTERDAEVRAPARKPSESGADQPAADASGESTDVSAEMAWPSRVDGVIGLAESFLAGHRARGSGGDRFQVMVHLDQDVLGGENEWSATLEDGSRVSAESLRRVACDCAVVAVGQSGESLNIGRRSRSIPAALRRALMVRDGGCAFPGCTHTRFLHGHHIEHWLHGGDSRHNPAVGMMLGSPRPCARGGMERNQGRRRPRRRRRPGGRNRRRRRRDGWRVSVPLAVGGHAGADSGAAGAGGA